MIPMGGATLQILTEISGLLLLAALAALDHQLALRGPVPIGLAFGVDDCRGKLTFGHYSRSMIRVALP